MNATFDGQKAIAQSASQAKIGVLRWRGWMRGAIATLGALWLTIYLVFRVTYINTTPALIVFALLLFVAELHSILHLYGMFYSLWPRQYQSWPHLNRSRELRCNLFVCVCGEPAQIVRETILAAQETARVYTKEIDPLHPPRVLVLNDGKVARKENWQEIEALCAELGAEHIARSVPGHFKSGNINNALQQTPTPDAHNTLDIIFDSDFAALPEFLLEITKPFVENDVDWVQSPQRYKNEETWVAKAAAAHQIFFFDHICPAKGHDNALFLCGTNFAIRRSALDAVNGFDPHYITEDYATSLNLHLQGRRGVFMPQVLALGAAPSSLKQYFTQQQRWSKGNFDVTGSYFKQLFFGPLTLKQKLHYLLSATYYLIGLRDLILMMAPLPYLFLGVSLIKPNNLWFLTLIYAPMMLGNFVLFLKMFRYPVKSLVLDVVSFPTYTAAFFSSLFKHSLGFVVTIKKYEREKPWAVYKPQIVIATALSIGLVFSFSHNPVSGYGAAVNYFWALFDALFLWFGFYLIVVENLNWGGWEARAKRQTANAIEPLAAQIAAAQTFAAEPATVSEPILFSSPVEKPIIKKPISVQIPEAKREKQRADDWSPSWEPRVARPSLPKPLRWPAEKLRARRRAFRESNEGDWR